MTCTKAEFEQRTAEHQLEILRDDGLYRHLRCRKPGTCTDGFDLVTWPGFLCYCGDMGEYVFQRSDDMLAFFRRRDLGINPEYWSEKVVAEDRDGVKRYSPVKLREAVASYLDDCEASPEIREAANELVLSIAGDCEHVAREAIDDFDHDGFQFQDFYEYDLTEFTYRFLFCCYALAWAVQRYDELKGTP